MMYMVHLAFEAANFQTDALESIKLINNNNNNGYLDCLTNTGAYIFFKYTKKIQNSTHTHACAHKQSYIRAMGLNKVIKIIKIERFSRKI